MLQVFEQNGRIGFYQAFLENQEQFCSGLVLLLFLPTSIVFNWFIFNVMIDVYNCMLLIVLSLFLYLLNVIKL